MEVDKKLIAKCMNYDKHSFMELYKMYEKYLYSLCFNYVQNKQDALDLIQEIYIKVFNNIKKFDINMPFHPWIRKIAVNTCLNFQRTIKSNVISMNMFVNDEDDITVEDTLVSDEDVLESVVTAEIKDIIKDNITKLSEEYRLILVLRYYEDLSYKEIAELINKPIGTVKTQIYRAKTLLRKKLKNVIEEG